MSKSVHAPARPPRRGIDNCWFLYYNGADK